MQADFGGVEWIFPSDVQAAILNLENSGEVKSLQPVGGRKKNWGGGRGRGKKNPPARTDCLFEKLRSPTNGDSDWCSRVLSD